MAFVSGMVMGLVLGIGLAFGFAYYSSVRSRRRFELAATVAAFANMTVEDSRKLLPGVLYPSWVIFTRRQKLTWLNLQLKKIWPYVDAAASELIRANVEPVLEQYKPILLSSLTFSKLTLGTVAPQFTGVEIIDSGKEIGEVVMELELQWDGNPNIELDIRTRVGVGLPVQVKNIGFTGVFRLIFKPLVDELPCFGAICYSLREKKNLDFKLKIAGGDISSVPGVSDAIEETIRDAIEDTITWPMRKIAPIIPGDYSYLELKPLGTLDVKLVQAKELTNKDLIGKSDPYAVLFVRPLRDKMQTSKVIDNQLNPIWNEHFEFTVEDPSTQHLTIRIFDDEGIQASELIGCAQISLSCLEPGKVKYEWLKLLKDLDVQRDNKNRGQVQLELLYCPFGTESGLKNPPRPDVPLTALEKALDVGQDAGDLGSPPKKDAIVRGVLSVTVIAAEKLPVTDILGKADPYVVLRMKKSEAKYKTRVLNNSLNPVWNQTFDIVVEDGLHDMLVVEVLDHDTFGKTKIGKCIMTLTKVILEGEVQDSYPLDGAKSGKIFLHLKWTPQSIFRDT
ncbi:hypothetical protein MLD38_007096 [Melastoma candidum]|uniref:Uncharacterized protein n=1 Tax=Melastoma candidum TaxID=119954 RepID=A0ACB9RP84_9MYRT|nr:hypothetical protein MLD38_007096 [Melastoma candidum]